MKASSESNENELLGALLLPELIISEWKVPKPPTNDRWTLEKTSYLIDCALKRAKITPYTLYPQSYFYYLYFLLPLVLYYFVALALNLRMKKFRKLCINLFCANSAATGNKYYCCCL